MGDDDKADDEAGAGIAAGAAGAMVGAAGAMAGAAGGAESDAEGPAFLTGRSRAEGGLAGSAADRIAAGEAVGEAWGPRSGAAGASGPLAAAPDAADVSGEAEAADARHDPAAFHDREPRVSDYGAGDRGAGDHGAGDRDAQGGISSAAGGGIVAEERRSIDRPGAGRRLPERRLPERRQPERRPSVAESRRQRAPVDVTGPAWEEPRRYEAYPTLRTRMGLPAVPPIVLAGLALVIAAVALFSLPTLLGFGNAPGPAAVSSPSPSQRGAAASVTPSAAPAATPTIYFVRAGDNLAKIAKRFGTTIDAILKANPQIKDPNRIKVGDQITIPVRKSGSGSAGPGSSPSSNP
jgi:hypothetical protein